MAAKKKADAAVENTAEVTQESVQEEIEQVAADNAKELDNKKYVVDHLLSTKREGMEYLIAYMEVILVLCYRIDSQYSILFGKYWSLIQDVLFCNILIQISHKADAYIHQRKLPCDIYHLQLSVVNLPK
mgnify:CR=1 FL=1